MLPRAFVRSKYVSPPVEELVLMRSHCCAHQASALDRGMLPLLSEGCFRCCHIPPPPWPPTTLGPVDPLSAPAPMCIHVQFANCIAFRCAAALLLLLLLPTYCMGMGWFGGGLAVGLAVLGGRLSTGAGQGRPGRDRILFRGVCRQIPSFPASMGGQIWRGSEQSMDWRGRWSLPFWKISKH
jgi:hypothetical protein